MLKNSIKMFVPLVLGFLLIFQFIGNNPVQEKICNFSVYVIDGDTFYLNGTKIRIYGIDAPELHKQKPWVLSKTGIRNTTCLREFGHLAKKRLKDLLKAQCLTLRYHGRDPYGRILAEVFACNETCVDVGKELVLEGLAISYRDAYKFEENYARKNNLGLWSCKK